MPEFTWKYGYIYVILLSVVVVTALTVFAKKKKWF
jgi:magnesium transporter